MMFYVLEDWTRDRSVIGPSWRQVLDIVIMFGLNDFRFRTTKTLCSLLISIDYQAPWLLLTI